MELDSFPFYHAEWTGSETVQRMAPAVRAIYWEVCIQAWIHGSIIDDGPFWIRKMGWDWAELESSWTALQLLKRKDGSRLLNVRGGRIYVPFIERKRPQIIEAKESRAKAARSNGTNGGRPRKNTVNPAITQTGLHIDNPQEPVRAGVPYPLPYPLPLPEGTAHAREHAGEQPDGQAVAWMAADDLHRRHAAAGLAPGQIFATRHAIEQILIGSMNFEATIQQLFRSHEAWVAFWHANSRSFKPHVARWINDGDWITPPAKIVAQNGSQRPKSGNTDEELEWMEHVRQAGLTGPVMEFEEWKARAK